MTPVLERGLEGLSDIPSISRRSFPSPRGSLLDEPTQGIARLRHRRKQRIGKACAEVFAREGCRLLLSARRIDRVEALAATLRSSHGSRSTRTVSTSEPGRSRACLRIARGLLEGIDILVNNAGLARGFSTLQEGSLSDWEEMIDTNVKGLLYVTRAVLPTMLARKRGHIINLGSIAGHQVYPEGNVYCATKFAVGALSEGLKMDLLGTGVRVANISPGLSRPSSARCAFMATSSAPRRPMIAPARSPPRMWPRLCSLWPRVQRMSTSARLSSCRPIRPRPTTFTGALPDGHRARFAAL